MMRFSRHAKRRAKLYDIHLSTIEDIVKRADLKNGKNEILATVPGHAYPLKIVVSVEFDVLTVISSYPLKKGVLQ